jgi:hypothetical protein
LVERSRVPPGAFPCPYRTDQKERLIMENTRLLAAVERFADEWGALIERLPREYHCTLSCSEAEAAAELFRAIGDEPTAEGILDAHADHDEPGDDHYKEPEAG